VKITAIRLDRMRLPLDPPFRAAWDPVPRRHFDATLVRVETDEGITGFGSGDTMDGFGAFVDLFIGRDPRQIARHGDLLKRISLKMRQAFLTLYPDAVLLQSEANCCSFRYS